MDTSVPMKELVNKTIISIKCGDQNFPSLGSYGAYTITTQSGEIYILWTAYNEINLSKRV